MKQRLVGKHYRLVRAVGYGTQSCVCGGYLWARVRRNIAIRLLFPKSRIYYCYGCESKTLVINPLME